MSDWLPIETAPKEGEAVLVMDRSGHMIVAYVRPGWNTWSTIPGAYGCEPTHWMPLPNPPASEREA